MVAIAEEVDFQSQQIQYKQAQVYTWTQAQEESQAVWELQRQLEKWHGRCSVCFIRGFYNSRHLIQDCIEKRSYEVQSG
jgi:squalene cyclase